MEREIVGLIASTNNAISTIFVFGNYPFFISH